jgi:hypothetical protein
VAGWLCALVWVLERNRRYAAQAHVVAAQPSSRRAVPGRCGPGSGVCMASGRGKVRRRAGSQARSSTSQRERKTTTSEWNRRAGFQADAGGRESQRAGCAEDGKAPKSSTTEAENGQIRLSPAKGTQPCLYPPMAGAGGCWLETPRSSGRHSAFISCVIALLWAHGRFPRPSRGDADPRHCTCDHPHLHHRSRVRLSSCCHG